MTIVRRMVRILILVLLWTTGIALLLAASSAARWEHVMGLGVFSRGLAAGLGGALALGGLLFAAAEYRGRKRERFLSFDTEGGVVSISTTAMADYISRLIGEFPSVVRMRPIVKPLRNRVDILVELRVKSGCQVQEVCGLMQQRVRESVVDGLGIADVRRVEISVREIVSEHRPG